MGLRAFCVLENTSPFLFRVGNRRKPSPALQRSTTTASTTSSGSTTTAPDSTTIKTKSVVVPPRRKYHQRPQQQQAWSSRPLESQDSTTQPSRTSDRFKFASRRPTVIRPPSTIPSTSAAADEDTVDQTKASSNQQSLEESIEDSGDTTELGDIALALHQIQMAPLPPKRKTHVTPMVVRGTTQRIIITRAPTRSRVRYSTTVPPIILGTTTKRLVRVRPSTEAFAKISSPSLSNSNTYRPLSEYDYYDDVETSILARIPEHSKVLLHSNGVIECLDQGNFPHPVSCKKFISCAKMEYGKVLGWEYTCPKNLSFDPIGGICNWSAGLGCNEQ